VAATPELARTLAGARSATARYVTDLGAAEKAGYKIITKMMPGMGYHYLNPTVQGFDVTKPAILVYVPDGDGWQLGALEWVWPEQPAAPPLPGATYGLLRRGLPLRGRHVRARRGRDRLREDQAPRAARRSACGTRS
jgi:hypothetical protein